MPFEESSKWRYDHVIRSECDGSFKVRRADEIQNQRSVMADILDGVLGADLVIADLTGLNANVMYELGIAHSFRKPTLIITDNVADLPFDFKAYRVLGYENSITGGFELRNSLQEFLKEWDSGKISFSNPVMDFGPSIDIAGPRKPEPFDGEEKGLLEYMSLLDTQLNRSLKSIEAYTSDLNFVSTELDDSTAEISKADANQQIAVRLRESPRIAATIEKLSSSGERLNSDMAQISMYVGKLRQFYKEEHEEGGDVSLSGDSRKVLEEYILNTGILASQITSILVVIKKLRKWSTVLKKPCDNFLEIHVSLANVLVETNKSFEEILGLAEVSA